jgi:hypothetical protein
MSITRCTEVLPLIREEIDRTSFVDGAGGWLGGHVHRRLRQDAVQARMSRAPRRNEHVLRNWRFLGRQLFRRTVVCFAGRFSTTHQEA